MTDGRHVLEGGPYKGTVLDFIGNTALLDLSPPGSQTARVYAKAEHLNPSGSVKDRAILSLFQDAIRSGRLTRDISLLDATSGNSGIAYGMIGAVLGYKVTLCLPANASAERKQILRSFQVTVVETDPLLGSDGSQDRAAQMARDNPDLYVYPDQYNNPENWKAHYRTTGVEVWDQTQGRVTHFVAGIGTSGTLMGTGRRLKDFRSDISVVEVRPDSPLHGLEGMRHLPTTHRPGFYDDTLVDQVVSVSTEAARARVRRLAAHHGLLVGPGSGANVEAALRLAETLPPESVVVTVLSDTGQRYLGERWWTQGDAP